MEGNSKRPHSSVDLALLVINDKSFQDQTIFFRKILKKSLRKMNIIKKFDNNTKSKACFTMKIL